MSSDNNVDNDLCGEYNSGNYTVPSAQHISGVSFLNLRTSQYFHIMFIFLNTTIPDVFYNYHAYEIHRK